MRILSGIQPSGLLHLGNYYGAIRQYVELQDQGEALYFIADLHSLTTVRDAAKRRSLVREIAVAFLAFGLDPARATLFRQSDIAEITSLYWTLGSVVPLASVERAHGYKDKVARGIKPDFGLFAYPILMAADILLYGADVVPVGKDQTQHIELARDWATRFNATYVPGYDPADPQGNRTGIRGVLKLPSARVQAQTAVVPGTDGQKMSKSYGNTIDLFGTDAEVKKQIMGVKTDSTPLGAPKPADSALLALLKLMVEPEELPEIERTWREGGVGYGTYKLKLLDAFHATFDGARRRREELLTSEGDVDRVLREGAERARDLAAPIAREVRAAVGIGSLIA